MNCMHKLKGREEDSLTAQEHDHASIILFSLIQRWLKNSFPLKLHDD